MRNFDLASGFKTINTEIVDSYTNNQLLDLIDPNSSFNVGDGLIINQIPAGLYSNTSTGDLFHYLDDTILGSSHSFDIGNGGSFFGTQAATGACYLYNQQSIRYSTEQYGLHNSVVYNPWYNMVIPACAHSFCDSIVQHPAPPLEQIINHQYIPEYSKIQEHRKPKKPIIDKVTNLSLKNKTCANCTTTVAPTWRRDKSRLILLCNACGLYEKLHNGHRQTIIENGIIKLVKNKNKKKKLVKKTST
jgi:hypothetical protein